MSAIVWFYGRMGTLRSLLRATSALLLSAQAYLRVVFVLVGAAMALALAITAFTLLVLAAEAGTSPWAVVSIGVVLIGGPLMVGLVPAIRQLEGVAAQALLLVQFHDGPPGIATTWPQRRRALAWFLLHLLIGALVVAAVIGLIALGASWWMIPAAAAALLATLLSGRLLSGVAPILLGPSYAERLERLEVDAARAIERTRLARELHDSIGHALSLVTVQASAARRMIDRNPAFVEDALATIESTSRRAVAELDHVLGLLRDETQRRDPSPTPDLGSLDGLLTAARAGGLRVDNTMSGDVTSLPPVVSREAYRIVQEGLTNALKYSADGTAALDMVLRGNTFCIRLANPVGGRQRARASQGRGLRGIEERATMLGGTATAHADGGRWTLSVELPVWDAQR